jgi:hypothetical protein
MARRHESLIPLSHDHHDALLLAWRLRNGDLSRREPKLCAGRTVEEFKIESQSVIHVFDRQSRRGLEENSPRSSG